MSPMSRAFQASFEFPTLSGMNCQVYDPTSMDLYSGWSSAKAQLHVTVKSRIADVLLHGNTNDSTASLFPLIA